MNAVYGLCKEDINLMNGVVDGLGDSAVYIVDEGSWAFICVSE